MSTLNELRNTRTERRITRLTSDKAWETYTNMFPNSNLSRTKWVALVTNQILNGAK